MKVTSKSAVFIFIVVLLLAGLVFYYVVALRSSTNQPKDAKPNQTVVTDKNTVPEQLSIVESAYKEYLKAMKTDDGDALATFNRSTTSDLAKKLESKTSGADPILCSQNVPASLKFSQPGIVGNTALVTVTAKFANDSQKITVTTDIKSDKISSIACVKDSPAVSPPGKPGDNL